MSGSPLSLSLLARVNEASLVPPIYHPPTILKLVGMEVTIDVVEYIAHLLNQIVQSIVLPPSPPVTPREKNHFLIRFSTSTPPPLKNFISNVIENSGTSMPTVLCALVYLAKVRTRLGFKPITGWPCSQHRVFIAALMTASKYANDSCLKNYQWAKIANFLGVKDLLSIEREFLENLGYDCSIRQSDILRQGAPLLSFSSSFRLPRSLSLADSPPASQLPSTRHVSTIDHCTPRRQGWSSPLESDVWSPITPSLSPMRFSQIVGRHIKHSNQRIPILNREVESGTFLPRIVQTVQTGESSWDDMEEAPDDPFISSAQHAIKKPVKLYHLPAPVRRRRQRELNNQTPIEQSTNNSIFSLDSFHLRCPSPVQVGKSATLVSSLKGLLEIRLGGNYPKRELGSSFLLD